MPEVRVLVLLPVAVSETVVVIGVPVSLLLRCPRTVHRPTIGVVIYTVLVADLLRLIALAVLNSFWEPLVSRL